MGGRRSAAMVGGLAIAALALGGVTAVGGAAPAIGLAGSGHWVVNKVANTAVHVDGGTRKVDAEVELPADSGEPLFVAENDRQGFVVSRDRAVVFGRSTLTVDSTVPLDFDEVPVGVETVGGPYLVYRRTGTVVRLGVPPVTLQLGGPVDRPVWTDDGTVWLRRSDDGSLCALRDGASEPDCPTKAADAGALTITTSVPAFVGSLQDAAQVLEPAALATPVALNTDVPESLLLSDRDTQGRLPFVVPESNHLVLADSSGVPAGRGGGAPVSVDLGPGRFTSPVASDGIVVLLDEATNRLLTFDVSGKLVSSAQLPPGAAASVVRGRDGRIYVDDADGTATHVVGRDGTVTTVRTDGGSGTVVAPPLNQVTPVPNPSLPRPPRPSPNGKGTSPQPIPVAPLLPPTRVTAVPESGNAARVSWQAVNGGPDAVRYVVTADTSPKGEVSATSLVVPGLPVGVPVTFTVRALAGTRSAESVPVTLTLRPPPPDAPTGVTAVSRYQADGSREVDLSWSAPNLNGGTLDHYEISGVGTPLRVTEPRAVVGRGFQLTGCKKYLVSVRAVTRAGAGPATPAQIPLEMDCAPKVLIESVQVDAQSVRVTVSAIGGAGDCTLSINDDSPRDRAVCGRMPPPPGYSQITDVPTVVLTAGGLEPGTTYRITVTASSEYPPRSSASETITTSGGQPPPAAPGPPTPEPTPEPEPEPTADPDPPTDDEENTG